MKIGICAQADQSPAAKEAGFDYIEPNAQQLLEGLKPDDQWKPKESALPMLSANVLVPAALKIVGPTVDSTKLHSYMATVARRAKSLGLQKLVFGSAGARNVPEGFDRDIAKRQIVEFARDAATVCKQRGVLLVIEALQRGECNIVNTIDEAAGYVKLVDHPDFRCLFDAYHFWLENEPIEHLRSAMPLVKHVHLADIEGRVAPGESGKSDYRPLFHVLRQGGYDDTVTVEASVRDLRADGPRVVKFIKDQWKDC